jgi:hypothetical protein
MRLDSINIILLILSQIFIVISIIISFKKDKIKKNNKFASLPLIFIALFSFSTLMFIDEANIVYRNICIAVSIEHVPQNTF